MNSYSQHPLRFSLPACLFAAALSLLGCSNEWTNADDGDGSTDDDVTTDGGDSGDDDAAAADSGEGGNDEDGGNGDAVSTDEGDAATDDAGTVVPVARCETSGFEWQSRPRAYIVCTPDPLPAGSLPVVLAFHGGSGNAAQWRTRTEWDRHGAANGYATVFLQGCKPALTDCAEPDGSYEWNDGKPGRDSEIDDQGFVLAVLERLATVHGLVVDAGRVFATGHSLGGIFTYSLACDHPGLLRAIGPISAPPSDGTCTPAAGTSIHHVHGTADDNVPFDTGCCSAAQKNPRDGEYLPGCDELPVCYNPNNWWPPVRTGLHPFTNVTGLDAMATVGLGCGTYGEENHRDGTTVCRRYAGCPAGAAADVCLVDGVDHKLADLLDAFDIRGWLWQRFSEDAASPAEP
ncbi:MAG: hypothetical protein JXB32_24425 [Deltaproteobacteria bacterium]|nr:hypothetical protein [Deltaproteobacteria bacterium]